MITKLYGSAIEAIGDIKDGAVIMIGGFGPAGQPVELIDALISHAPKHLTLISNNAGNGDFGLAALLKAGCVDKMICSFPRQSDSWVFDELYREKRVALELVPQGNLVARIQAAGAGIGAFYTPTGFGTALTEGKETREIAGKHYVLEYPLAADYALIKAHRADRWGNLTFNKAGRNFGPIMAAAASCTIAQTTHIAELGDIDPEVIVTPGIFVNRVVHTPDAQTRLSA
ncbi:3-oxoacid CoA-transferase subunit A [Tatumella ptyseos]|uniref:3-oxoacid CoA-transferase subunit A n=1 Tax=Tatumella ptyseos TaxID=82987 RepID=UPI0026F178F5|nr:3-oxoacid CoA-transferase subunit A [Tatumella ptyseos]WKX27926.1 3-oxoacid CoA-transferase subunit A [Tatumella ptyseos]